MQKQEEKYQSCYSLFADYCAFKGKQTLTNKIFFILKEFSIQAEV